MTTIQKLESDIEALKTDIESHPLEVKAIYLHGVNLRELYAEKFNEARQELTSHNYAKVTDRTNTVNRSFWLVQNSEVSNMIHLKFLSDLVEGMDEFKAAVALIQPQVDQLATLEADLADEIEARNTRIGKLREAEGKAVAKALQDPKLAAIRAELAEVS